MLPEHDYVSAPETPAQIYAAYLVHLQRRDRGNTAYAQAARSFLRRWPRVQAWADLPLDKQLAANCSTRPFIIFLMVSRRLQPGYDYQVLRIDLPQNRWTSVNRGRPRPEPSNSAFASTKSMSMTGSGRPAITARARPLWSAGQIRTCHRTMHGIPSFIPAVNYRQLQKALMH